MTKMAFIKDINMADGVYNKIFNTIGNLSTEEVRGCSLEASAHRPRSHSIFLNEDEEEYHVRVKKASNRMDKDEPVALSDSTIQLEYETRKGQKGQTSKTARVTMVMYQQRVLNEVLALNQPAGNNVVNVQLSYNINQALELESWDGDFQTISLHGSMEHLASDVKNIKDSLSRMCKYILGKTINDDKANEVHDLKGVGKVAWEFILAIYEAHWNSLVVDETNISFRNKVKSKFSPQVSRPQVSIKAKEIAKPTFVLALPPLIPAKSPKEVNEISKYFKRNKKQSQKKSYAQASSLSRPFLQSNSSLNITLDTLKIKETFPYLQNKKIDQVQKIINGTNDKLKPCLNMTTKGPSQKQVIIPMNKEAANQYLKDSSMYMININCAFKGIKSNIIADFIRVEDKEIMITTNNVASPSDLQEIKKCIKNSFSTEVDQIFSLRLLQSKLYLKIVGIPFISKRSNIRISSDKVESILKANHVFNNIILMSKPRIIKVSPKSDMAIIWINIWDTQNGSNAKKIINRCFNIRSFIAIV